MPHLVLEYSANIIEQANLSSLFQSCHILLAEMLPTNISSCKSRAIKHETYFLGDGDANNAFVHLEVKVMPGRELAKLKIVSEKIMDILKKHYLVSASKLKLQISVEVSELKETYVKFTRKL